MTILEMQRGSRGTRAKEHAKEREPAQPSNESAHARIVRERVRGNMLQKTPGVHTIEDLRRAAKRRLPRVVFDYIDGGAETEWTMRENMRAFEDVTFRPRSGIGSGPCSLATTVLGQRIELPFLLAPVGSSRAFYPRGECVAAAEAGRAGTGYILSTFSGCTLEDVVASTNGPAWYQLYLAGGREVASAAIERAHRAGYSALVITIDTSVSGMRERDVRNGAKQLLGNGFFEKLPFAGQVLGKPAWLYGVLRDGGMMRFANVVLPGGPMPFSDAASAISAASFDWSDLAWIREIWRGPIVIKGVQSVEDARRSVDIGANAIVVSNHGGRQLDGAPASVSILPEIASAVSGETEVYLDGGIRRGSDIVKALALGARAVLIGRAYAYGLGASGGRGVARAIDILSSDIVSSSNTCHARSPRS